MILATKPCRTCDGMARGANTKLAESKGIQLSRRHTRLGTGHEGGVAVATTSGLGAAFQQGQAGRPDQPASQPAKALSGGTSPRFCLRVSSVRQAAQTSD